MFVFLIKESNLVKDHSRFCCSVGDYKLIEGYPGVYQSWYKPDSVDQGVFISFPQINNMVANTTFLQQLFGMNLPSAKYQYLFNLKGD